MSMEAKELAEMGRGVERRERNQKNELRDEQICKKYEDRQTDKHIHRGVPN